MTPARPAHGAHRKPSGNVQGTFGEHSGNIEHSENVQGFWDVSTTATLKWRRPRTTLARPAHSAAYVPMCFTRVPFCFTRGSQEFRFAPQESQYVSQEFHERCPKRSVLFQKSSPRFPFCFTTDSPRVPPLTT
jgi:hypothetical protein